MCILHLEMHVSDLVGDMGFNMTTSSFFSSCISFVVVSLVVVSFVVVSVFISKNECKLMIRCTTCMPFSMCMQIVLY